MTRRYDLFDGTFDKQIAKPREHWPLVTVGVIAAVAILLLAGSGHQTNCQHIADSATRLACFDAAALPQPAKGAPIPAVR